jgi:hypothetical protein
MNYLVFLDTHAGELEKILSGVKSMIVKDIDPGLPSVQRVMPGDSLYFLRDNDECTLRVKATVVQAVALPNDPGENLSQALKEMQPRLQFTEDQYNCWSAKERALLVEFAGAQKINLVKVAAHKVADQSDWIAFDTFSRITE